MDDDILQGDVDAWFEAFEQGNFLRAWKNQQKQCQEWLAKQDNVTIPFFDASDD